MKRSAHRARAAGAPARGSVGCILALACWSFAQPATAFHVELDPPVHTILEAPHTALRAVPRSFRIIALSNLAESCVHRWRRGELAQDDAARCVTQLVDLAQHRDVSPLGGPAKSAALGEHGLYLAHLNIVLAAYRRVVGDDVHRDTQTRISRRLAERSLASPIAHVASYPSSRRRWPADQAAVLYSLFLHDREYGTELAREPIQRWLEVMRTRGRDERWHLHRSELTGRARGAELPRGCALSWTIRYMASFAPEAARELWTTYRHTFAVERGIVYGFREWPPGVDRPADIDSGPIVAGIGAAASGLAIGAAKAMGDDVTVARLLASAELASLASEVLGATRTNLLAQAIELSGRTTTPWFDER